MINTYMVIVCGNYETKIMIAMIQKMDVRLLYIDEFLSNDLIEDSILIDSLKFKDKIFSKMKKIKKLIGYIPEKIILNIPTKNIDTITSTSSEYKLSNYLTQEFWNRIYPNLTLSESQLKGDYLLGKNTFNWKLDEIDYMDIPFNIKGEKLIFKTQYYITNKKYVEPFLNVFKSLEIEISEIVVDSMIIPKGFLSNLRNNKAFINIGHDKSNIFYYKNSSLNKKEIINFGLKNLTNEIMKKTNINEIDAIKFLKIYKNMSSFDMVEVPFKVSIAKKIGKCNTFTYRDTNLLIKEWLNELTNKINDFYNELEKRNEEIDEIYLLSATNIFEKWIHHIKAKLNSRVDVLYINNNNIKFNNECINIIGFNEPKYISLIYSLFYIHEQLLIKSN